MRFDVFGSPEYFGSSIFGLSYGGGARVSLVYKNHYTLTTGLQYLRIAVPGNPKAGLNYLPPGSLKNIQVPLLLGYTTGSDRFNFFANAGALFTTSSHAGGEMARTGNFPNRNGIIGYFSLGFSSHVTSKVSIFAEPYLKSWHPKYNQYQPYQWSFPSHVWSTGLMVGVRFNF